MLDLGRLAECGMLNCRRIFTVKGDGSPALYTCPECEEKMNRGIQFFLHSHTERVTGNFNLLEKLNGSLRISNSQ